jgi:glycine oxidase
MIFQKSKQIDLYSAQEHLGKRGIMEKEVDYIIVGQGLAGSVLAMQLLEMGKKIYVFDQNNANSSSKVAGGLFNPITGKKMLITWKALDLFPFMFDFYQKLENRLNEKFFFPIDLYRPFKRIADKNDWIGSTSNEKLDFFVKGISEKSAFSGLLKDDFGGIFIKFAGYLNVSKMLFAVKNLLLKENSYKEELFLESNLVIENNSVYYQGIKAKKIIFCQGSDSSKNKLFDWLPHSPVKGELLYVKLPVDLELIINRGVFLIPIGDRLFKVGATYEWNDLESGPTAKGRKELEEKLEDLLKVPFEVVNHLAGVRPATKDRKPYLGLHPEFKTIAIFNGLGTKGVSLAPFFADHLCKFLEYGKPLITEVNIERYFSFYYN